MTSGNNSANFHEIRTLNSFITFDNVVIEQCKCRDLYKLSTLNVPEIIQKEGKSYQH